MLSRSSTYLSLYADANHSVEWRVSVNGTIYEKEKLAASTGGGDALPRLTRNLFSGSTPTIGGCCAATFECTIFEASSNVPRMATVIPSYRLVNGSTTSEWITLGTFFIDTRSVNKSTGALSLFCYDRMLMADGVGGASYADVTGFDEWPQSMSNVVNEIASIIGVTVDSRTSISFGNGYMVEFPNDYTMREVLGYIAVAHCGNWCITPDNKLRLIPLTGGNGSFNLGSATASLKASDPLAAYSGVTVYWADEDAYTAGTDTGTMIEADCPWATQDTADGMLTAISGYSYQPYTASGAFADLALELGDSLTVGLPNQTVTGPCFSIDITCDVIEAMDISAPGEAEVDHEYPYTDYVNRSLKRRVGLGQPYYGVTISRKNGMEIKRSDGASEALFNSDVFSMRAIIDGVMKDRIYFDPVKGDYVFEGALGADAVFTDSLYAELGDIAELTVDRLSTSKRVRLYNLRNTSDDNFLEIQDNYLRLITGTVIFESGTPLTEQATNRYGNPLYWSEIPYSINSQGYPLDEDGNQIYATTDQPTPGEGETLDDYKVLVYRYAELTKAELAFVDESGTYVPMLIMGAGDNYGRTQGTLHKSANSFDIGFVDVNGNEMGIRMNSYGYMDLEGLRRATEIDFSNFELGNFTETVDGNVMYFYNVQFDVNGDPVRIYDAEHGTDIVWW